MPSVSFGSFSKRRNSTKQPVSLSDQRTVKLKEATSVDAPTFILTGNDFSHNYAKWDDRYYFIVDIRSIHNNMIEVDCVLDPLATYKDYILASTQFVTYSSFNSSKWLADTRIPVTKQTITTAKGIINPEISKLGNFVLSVNGQNGCELYKISRANIVQLLNNLNTWKDDAVHAFLDNLVAPGSDLVVATENLYTVLARSGAFSNAYAEAPNCIRSCIWVPFGDGAFDVIQENKPVYLGQFDTGVTADAISAAPHTSDYDVSIDWYYSDWRRGTCEDLYVYLPLVGTVNISAENITDQNTLTVMYSIGVSDGTISYELRAGSQIIGVYGASCAANYPIGISQQSSAGELMTSFFSGGENMLNAAINSSISPISTAAAAGGVALEGVKAVYDTTVVSMSRHNSVVGGAGGGVGAGLDLAGQLFHVVHPTILNPSEMRATMGLPTMKPMLLSSLSGFCQCANAHVDAPAMANELDAIDSYLNTGFYIE